MTRRDPPAPDAGAMPDLEGLARDWITLWQSELAAVAVDREQQEAWQTLLALWANAASAMVVATVPRPASSRGPVDEHGHPRPAAAARAAPADAASDARDAEVERLSGRVRELERRLADLERGGR